MNLLTRDGVDHIKTDGTLSFSLSFPALFLSLLSLPLSPPFPFSHFPIVTYLPIETLLAKVPAKIIFQSYREQLKLKQKQKQNKQQTKIELIWAKKICLLLLADSFVCFSTLHYCY